MPTITEDDCLIVAQRKADDFAKFLHGSEASWTDSATRTAAWTKMFALLEQMKNAAPYLDVDLLNRRLTGQ